MDDDIDTDKTDTDTHIGSGSFTVDCTLDGMGNKVGSARNVGIAVVESEVANSGYSGVMGVADVRAEGRGAGSYLSGGVEVVPVGSCNKIVRVVDVAEVVAGGDGGDVFDNDNRKDIATHASTDMVHNDIVDDAVHIAHTSYLG